MQLDYKDFFIILPLTILVAWACALLLADLFIPKERKGSVGAGCCAGIYNCTNRASGHKLQWHGDS
jgi:hypothetical protein